MNIKEQILTYYYQISKGNSHSVAMYSKTLADSFSFPYSETRQACKELGQSGYLKVSHIGGDILIERMTPSGFDYVEKNLLKDRDIAPGDGNDFSDDFNDDFASPQSIMFSPSSIDGNMMDSTTRPCFGVDTIASSYLEMLEKVCETDMDNVSMLGIFGAWGQGKSFFFKRLKKLISDRADDLKFQYQICEFNAWKYQDTPALWAYLYKSLYDSFSSSFKIGYYLKRNIGLLVVLLIILLEVIITVLSLKDNTGWIVKALVITISTITAFFIAISNQKETLKAFKRSQLFRERINRHLGIKGEIESELEKLLKHREKRYSRRKILLYVEDIDRCEGHVMVNLVESLRSVLENPEIRKRVVVICSIDSDKLMRALRVKYKNLFSDEISLDKESKISELDYAVREQMNKIFISGIALPKLSLRSVKEFLEALTQSENDPSDKDVAATPAEESVGPMLTENFIQSAESIANEVTANHVSEMVDSALNYINSFDNLTPRQIRIAYYRSVLAINLLTRLQDGEFDHQLIFEIVQKTVAFRSDGLSEPVLRPELQSVVSMVVPY